MKYKLLLSTLLFGICFCLFMSIIQTISIKSIANNNKKSNVVEILKLIKKQKNRNYLFNNLEGIENIEISDDGFLLISYKKDWR